MNSEKMSKSKGNFLTLKDAALKYSASGARFALADAGDTLEVANFEESAANQIIPRLFKELQWMQEVYVEGASGKVKSTSFAETAFEHQIRDSVKKVQEAFTHLQYREVVKCGFFDLQHARDRYLITIGDAKPNPGLLSLFCEVQVQIIAPIIPHWSEYAWRTIFKKGSVSIFKCSWPSVGEPDILILKKADHLSDMVYRFRKKLEFSKTKLKKGADPITKGVLSVCPSYAVWQQLVLKTVAPLFNKDTSELPDGKIAMEKFKEVEGLKKCFEKGTKIPMMPFYAQLREDCKLKGRDALAVEVPFDEFALFSEVNAYMCSTLGLQEISIVKSSDPDDPKQGQPLQPAMTFK